MRLVYGLTTYSRLDRLKENLSSWDETRNRNHKWTVIVADDGSEDGSIEYVQSLKFDNTKIIHLLNNRRGVHYQINQILKICSSMKFDIGFRAEDDFKFTKKGWDNLYIKAIKLSGYDHLVYYDPEWRRIVRGTTYDQLPKILKPQLKIQSKSINAGIPMGIFWTFTNRVINKIGYIDVQHFGLYGHGHSDYTMRCCRAGFNNFSTLFDAYGSENLIKMYYDYSMSPSGHEHGLNRFKASEFGLKKPKGKVMQNRTRLYIPYAEFQYDMRGNKI